MESKNTKNKVVTQQFDPDTLRNMIKYQVSTALVENKEIEAKDINLKRIYLKEQDNYLEWVFNLNITESRKSKIISDNKKLFSHKIKTILDIKKTISTFSKGTKINSSFRNFVKYLSESGILKLKYSNNTK